MTNEELRDQAVRELKQTTTAYSKTKPFPPGPNTHWGKAMSLLDQITDAPVVEPPPDPIPPDPVPAAAKLGVYRGAANPNGVQAFGTWLGKQPQVAQEFLGYANWTDNEGAAWNLQPWAGRYRLTLSVSPWPNNITSSIGEAASGAFNSHYLKLGQNLVAYGHANAILRLAWEFTADWMKWAVRSTAGAASYAQMHRQFVNSVRQAAGQQFQFDWNPCDGYSNKFDPFLSYPGDEFVDYISLDVYDNYMSANASEWQQRRSYQWGIDYFIKQAVQRNKLVAFPEWGLVDTGHWGHGDHAEYIQWMHDLISDPANRVGYHCYFDYQAPDGAHKVSPPEGPSQFPNGSATYKALFS